MSLVQSIAACPNTFVQQTYYTSSLMELGNQLLRQSRFHDAQRMYDMAHVVLRQPLSTTSEAVSAQIQWGYKSLLSSSFSDESSSSCETPDLYLDDECDVGPRPFRSPTQVPPMGIHGIVSDSDAVLMEATILYNKGVACQSLSQYVEAASMYEMTLQLASAAQAQPHLSELAMRLQNNLGVIEYRVPGLCQESNPTCRFEAAMAHAKNLPAATSSLLQLNYATVVSNWCRVQWLSGNISPVVYDGLKNVLRIRTSVLGWNHVDTAAAHYNMGVAEYSQDNFAKAMKHLMQYLQVAAAQVQGSNQARQPLDLVPALIYILLIKNEDSKTGVAQELVRGLRSLQEKRAEIGTGISDPDMASALNYIGTLLFHQQDFDHALLFFQEELRIEENLVVLAGSRPGDRDDASVSVSVTCNNLGRILQELQRYLEAATYYHRALQTDYEATMDTSDVCTKGKDAGTSSMTLQTKTPVSELPPSQVNLYSTVWYNLGLIHDKLGEYYDAIHAFKTSLALRKVMLGNDHPDISCLLYNIGVLQMEQQMLRDATISFREALRIRRLTQVAQTGRLNDCHIVKTLQKLATLQKEKGDIESALDAYREVLKIQQGSQDYSESHKRQRDMGVSMKEIAELLLTKGQLTPAMEMAQGGVSLLKNVASALLPLSAASVESEALFEYVGCVEELVSLLMLLGSLYHESCDSLTAGALYKEASGIIQQASQHFSTTTELDALYEVTELLGSVHCAAEA